MLRTALVLGSAILVAGCSTATESTDASVGLDASACKEGEFEYLDNECQDFAPPQGRTCTGRGDGRCYARCTTVGEACLGGTSCAAVRLYSGGGVCPTKTVTVCVPDGWKDGCLWPGADAGSTGPDAS